MTTEKTTDYQALHSELDTLLSKLQDGDLTIDEALKAFKRGQEIIVQLQKYLKSAENTVTKLTLK